MAKNERTVIWAAYFDAAISREDGRRISKKLAVQTPDIGKIYAAAKNLGLNPILEKEKKYPSKWWESKGRILVDRKESKTDIINAIAKKLKT